VNSAYDNKWGNTPVRGVIQSYNPTSQHGLHGGTGTVAVGGSATIPFNWREVAFSHDAAAQRGCGHIPESAKDAQLSPGDPIEYRFNHSQWPVLVISTEESQS
jgi:hypothetical protein